MNSIRIRKVMRDLFKEKGKLSLVVLAVFIGIFSTSLLSTANFLLTTNLSVNYLDTNPASFTLTLDNIDTQLIETVRSFESVESTETRTKIVTRIEVDDNKWLPMHLFVVDDFNAITLNKFTLENGQLPIVKKDIVLERGAHDLYAPQIDQSTLINIPGYGKQALTITGFVHHPGLAPSLMEGTIYGFIAKESLEPFNYPTSPNTLMVKLNTNSYGTKTDISAEAHRIKATLESKGYENGSLKIYKPKTHPHQTQLNTLLFLLKMFGLLSLVLSGFIIITMISSIMEKQMRQIGILKTVGASNNQIIGIYLGFVLIITFLSAVLAIPLGIWVGYLYSNFACQFLNFNLIVNTLPVTTLLSQFFFTFSMPLIMVFYPIYKASKISIHEAIYKDIKSNSNQTQPRINFSWLNNTLIKMASRNIFREKTRFMLIVLILSLGGSIFITAINIKTSSDVSVNQNFEKQPFDIFMNFTEQYEFSSVSKTLLDLPEVDSIEPFNQEKAFVVYKDKSESNSVVLRSILNQPKLQDFELAAGKWFDESSNNQIIINTMLKSNLNQLDVGQTITLRIGKDLKNFEIVGVVKEGFVVPTFYTKLTDPSQVNSMLVDIKEGSPIGFLTSSRIESKLEKENIFVSFFYTKNFYEKLVVEHLVIIVVMLLFMTLLTILVGGLGLMTTMSINILERTRELGTLQALGMNRKALYQLILYEGVIIGILSWFASILISLPMSYYLGNQFYNIFFEQDIVFSVSYEGMFVWLILISIFTLIASLIPAKNLTRMNLHEALSYE